MNSEFIKAMALGSALTLAAMFAVEHATEEAPVENERTPESKVCLKKQALEIGGAQSRLVGNDSTVHDRTSENPIKAEIDFSGGNECTRDCLQRLTNALLSGLPLRGESLDLASENAQELAIVLEGDPDNIEGMETLIMSLENSSERESLLFVLSKLPTKLLTQSAQRFIYSNSPMDRLAGVSLLEASSGLENDVSLQLSELISTESDEQVLARALGAIETLSSNQVDAVMQRKLSNLIERGNSEQIKGSALMAKISVVNDDELVRNDIDEILSGSSNNMKLVGLQALEKVLARQKYKSERGRWRQQSQFKQRVLSLANDVETDITVRIEALNLLRRNF